MFNITMWRTHLIALGGMVVTILASCMHTTSHVGSVTPLLTDAGSLDGIDGVAQPVGGADSTPCCPYDGGTPADGCDAAAPEVCNGRCTDLNLDSNNCGACGNLCPNGAYCAQGECTCADESVVCETDCTELSFDPTNCGACGHTCPLGAVCFEGTCYCPGGMASFCSGVCLDLASDDANCGACGTVGVRQKTDHA